LKDIDALLLVRAIQDAYNGVLMMPARIAAKLAARIAGNKGSNQRMSSAIDENNQGLTVREKEIALLVGQNFSNRQIARKLFLSEGTVKNYISEIYSKLGTSDREQASMLINQMYNRK
jgi:DNA-binding NarL/FixJ family response regulator